LIIRFCEQFLLGLKDVRLEKSQLFCAPSEFLIKLTQLIVNIIDPFYGVALVVHHSCDKITIAGKWAIFRANYPIHYIEVGK
jgi:hypothetical protein